MKVFPLFKNTIFTQNLVAGDSHCADKDLGYESGCKQQVNEDPEQQALCPEALRTEAPQRQKIRAVSGRGSRTRACG